VVTQFLFLLPAKGVVAVPGFGLWVLACELCGIGNAARTGLEEKLLLGRILVVVQQLAGGSELGRALEEKLSPCLLFGFKEAEEVAANGAADWVQGLPLELPQVPAVLLRPPHPGLHQRCHAAFLPFLI